MLSFLTILFTQLGATIALETGDKPGSPWWVTAITGSGGALVVFMLWVRSLLSQVKQKDRELLEISKESVCCITKLIERQKVDEAWRNEIEEIIRTNNRILTQDNKGTWAQDE